MLVVMFSSLYSAVAPHRPTVFSSYKPESGHQQFKMQRAQMEMTYFDTAY